MILLISFFDTPKSFTFLYPSTTSSLYAFFFLLCLIKQTTIAYNIHCHNSTQQWLSARKKGSRRGRASWVFGMVFFIYYYIVYLHFSRLRVWPGITTAAVALNNDKEALSQAPCMYVLSFFVLHPYFLTILMFIYSQSNRLGVQPPPPSSQYPTARKKSSRRRRASWSP